MARAKNRSKLIYAIYFGIPYNRLRGMTPRELEQLENCESLEAMRLLLGITRKEKSPVREGKLA